jgi:hypothetical protein
MIASVCPGVQEPRTTDQEPQSQIPNPQTRSHEPIPASRLPHRHQAWKPHLEKNWHLEKPTLTGFLNRDILPASRANNACRPGRSRSSPGDVPTTIKPTKQNRPYGVCIGCIVLAGGVTADLEAASAGMEASVPLRYRVLSIRARKSFGSETAGASASVLRTNRSRKRLVSFAPLGLCLSGGFFARVVRQLFIEVSGS